MATLSTGSPQLLTDIVTYDHLERNGRLGNQLWQIAWQLGEAERRGARPVIKEDWTYRPYFSIPDELYRISTCAKGRIDGGKAYFQEYRYFANVADKIKNYFQPSPEACAYIRDQWGHAMGDRWASVHVRRGDYLRYPNHFPLPTSRYYHDAIADVWRRKHGIKLAVFSDDIKWCMENPEHFSWPEDAEVVFVKPVVNGPQSCIDLFSMSVMCEEHVLSNSTFAWWGAFLSQNPHPIYPSVWFGPAAQGSEHCLLAMPDSWRKLDCCPSLTQA